MSPQWIDFINKEMSKPYMASLRSFISEERKTKPVYPAPDLLFSHMALCPFDRLKVIIIGNNPFPIDVNDGMAFSARGYHAPEENKNILYEAYKDFFHAYRNSSISKNVIFPTSQLHTWAKQGVLLLNMICTCTDGNAKAHAGKGWEQFNSALLDFLSDYPLPLVFINKSSYDIKPHINYRKHLILDAGEKKWCTLANDFISKRDVPATQQHLQFKINWTTKNLD